MKKLLFILALALGSSQSFAATALPEEKKGDPAPDTKVAQDVSAFQSSQRLDGG